MNGYYKSRATQMRSFARKVRSGKMSLNEALRSACMYGACEERGRTLRLIESAQRDSTGYSALSRAIISVSVSELLGYKTKKGGKRK